MPAYAPYSVPINNASKNEADSIYYGWMGLVSDPAFVTAAAGIISLGIKNALTDQAVVDAAAAGDHALGLGVVLR